MLADQVTSRLEAVAVLRAFIRRDADAVELLVPESADTPLLRDMTAAAATLVRALAASEGTTVELALDALVSLTVKGGD